MPLPEAILEALKNGEGEVFKNLLLDEERDGSSGLHILTDLPKDKILRATTAIYRAYTIGHDLDKFDKKGNTALHAHCSKGSPWQVIKAFLRVGANPYQTNSYGQVPKDLIKDPEIKRKYEMFIPTLADAIEGGNEDRVKELVDRWCLFVTGGENDVVELAKAKGYSGMANDLEDWANTSMFITYTLAADLKNMKDTFDKYEGTIEKNLWDEAENPPQPFLVEVIQNVGDPEVVDFLLQKGFQINSWYKPLNGPIYFMVDHDDYDVPVDVALAVLKHADLTLNNNKGQTALFLAQRRGVPDYINKLLSTGVNLAHRDVLGHTVVDDAIFHGRYNILPSINEWLLDKIEKEDIDTLETLAIDGYDRLAEVKDADGKKVETIVKEKGLNKSAQFFDNIAAIYDTTKVLHDASQHGNLDGITKIISDKYIHASDKGGRTMLHHAVMYNQPEVVRYLVTNYPACINDRDNFRRTPLHYAAALGGDFAIYKYLQEAGANEELRDCFDRLLATYEEEMSKPPPGDPDQVQGMIEREKTKKYGYHVYLKGEYDLMKQAIDQKDLAALKMHFSEFTGYVDDFVEYGIKKNSIMFDCIEKDAEDLAIFLLENGAALDVYRTFGSVHEALHEAAYAAGMKDLYRTICDKLGMSRRHSLESEVSLRSSVVPDATRQIKMLKKYPPPSSIDSKYLAFHLGEALQMGMAEITVKRPYDPIEYLAHFLRKFRQNADRDQKMRAESFELDKQKVEAEREAIRQKRYTREEKNIKHTEKEKLRLQRMEEEKARRAKAEEEAKLKELRSKKGEGEHYTQAPDLATVSEEPDQPEEVEMETTTVKYSDVVEAGEAETVEEAQE